MSREPFNEKDILTQNASSSDRKLGLRSLIAISSIPLFGIYAAFGIAPQTVTEDIQITTISEDVVLPSISEAADHQTFWQLDSIRRDDTLGSLMDRLNIKNPEAISFLRNDPAASGLASNLRPGNSIQALTNEQGELIKLRYETSPSITLSIDHTSAGYKASVDEPALETHTVHKSAVIKSSLFEATDNADIPDQIALQLAEIFSSDIDFHSDLRSGDHFAVIYEAGYNNGKLAKVGQILAAEFTNEGKKYQAVLYRNSDGKQSYYTPDGKSLQKSFLRSPLEFSRVSSGFSLGRFHPILQKIRAHKGVDYAAPSGTRIKASADGVVAFAGTKGGYGNVVILQHANGVSTLYGHLSRFSAGMRKGTRVAQGEIIGFVGMSGLATGPHLHYEFLVNGQHRDPLKAVLPVALPIPEQFKADFMASSQSLVSQLNLLSVRHLAVLK